MKWDFVKLEHPLKNSVFISSSKCYSGYYTKHI